MVGKAKKTNRKTKVAAFDSSASHTAARWLLRGADLALIGTVVIVSLILILAMASYSRQDPHWMQRSVSNFDIPVENWVGPVGAEMAGFLLWLIGLAAWLIPFAMGLMAWNRLRRRSLGQMGWQAISVLLLLLSSASLLALGFGTDQLLAGYQPGGVIGDLVGLQFFFRYFKWGSWVFLLVAWGIAFVFAGGTPVARAGWRTLLRLGRLAQGVNNRTRVWLARQRRASQQRREEKREAARERELTAEGAKAKMPAETPAYSPQETGERSLPAFAGDATTPMQAFDSISLDASRVLPNTKTALSGETSTQTPAFTVVRKKEAESKSKPSDKQLSLAIRKGDKFTLPATAILDDYSAETHSGDEGSFRAQAQMLQGKLKDFGVRGSVEKAHAGPVITVFEFRLSPGTRVSQLTKLEEDLALSLATPSVRICRFPNRDVMGIEVPAPDRKLVPMKAIVDHDCYRKKGIALPFALGKNVFGEPMATDLTKMPHLLIGGSTGSGKSVAINTLLLSLLFRKTPDELKLFMIDPKRLELNKYEKIPHLGYPVVCDARDAVAMLRMLVRIMTARYDLMAQAGVRNISGYNKVVRKGGNKVPENARPMPYVVCIVDELADLMMLARKEVEEPIARLAQMARAAGIHLVLATQRPSVDVITGLIKSNFPARIAFKVSARVDSKTILDEIGAQNLLGKGDMLFLDPALGSITRIHGAFVSDEEVDRVCDFWREQGEPEPMFSAEELAALHEEETGASSGNGSPVDKNTSQYEQAVTLAIQDGEISISRIQRVLGIGYNKAANLIDKMEEEGVVGPPQGAGKRRQVLIKPHELTPPGEPRNDL